MLTTIGNEQSRTIARPIYRFFEFQADSFFPAINFVEIFSQDRKQRNQMQIIIKINRMKLAVSKAKNRNFSKQAKEAYRN